MTTPSADELLAAACGALSRRFALADAESQVTDAAGLYAIHGEAAIWYELGLDAPPDGRPLYVGKAEESLVRRDLQQHFRSGSTGRSTVRRTFAALLAGIKGWTAVPRNPTKPDKFSHFALCETDEAALTSWMNTSLQLAVWPKPDGCSSLHVVEERVLQCWVPPLNIQHNRRSPWRKQVRRARQEMATRVRNASRRARSSA